MECISLWTLDAHTVTLKYGNRTYMYWTVIFQKIIWELRLRKLWYKLLERPERGLPHKSVNLIRSEQSDVVFVTYDFLID